MNKIFAKKSYSSIVNTTKYSLDIPIKKQTVYIIDFLNIFSDFREIKYKKYNIDFHSVKHLNKIKDTYDFFELFFTKYIDYTKIDKNSKFYFIMKKLHDYDNVLDDILKRYHKFNLKFIIIEDKYKHEILDKNKDDFLCQYFLCSLKEKYNCILISNDKYRDNESYIKLFNFDILIRIINYNKIDNTLEKINLKIKLTNTIIDTMITQKYKRCTIPKKQLNIIL
jgi:hypothetical protein